MRTISLVPIALSVASVVAVSGQVRDAGVSPVAGTATIAGQVVTNGDQPRPVRLAIVTVASDSGTGHSAVTDDAGRFAIGALPAGRYRVSASKTAYLPSVLGAARPGRTGTALALTAGERADVTLRMTRGAVLTGTVRDENGRAAQGVAIRATDSRVSEPGALLTAAPALTDDRGVYRIFGLMPGDYYISGTAPLTRTEAIQQRSTADTDAALAALQQRSTGGIVVPGTARQPAPAIPEPAGVAYAPTYFPGVPDLRQATRVTVVAEEERGGLDFVLAPVRVAAIEGTISGAVSDMTAVQLLITVLDSDWERRAAGQVRTEPSGTPILSMRPDARGRFRYTNVLPGRYRIAASISKVDLSAAADVDVQGQDVGGIALVLQPGGTFSGRIQFDAAKLPPPKDKSTWRVHLRRLGGHGGYFFTVNNTRIGNLSDTGTDSVRADGTFRVTAIRSESYELEVSGPELGQGWSMRSAIFNGRDLLDLPIDLTRPLDMSGVVVTMTDRRTELTGTLQTPTGTPAPDYFVIVFPSDPTLWRAGSRRVKTTRPGTDGAFVIRDLPPGSYLIAALTDVTASDWNNPAFLQQVAPSGVPVTLGEGERKVQDLQIASQ